MEQEDGEGDGMEERDEARWESGGWGDGGWVKGGGGGRGLTPESTEMHPLWEAFWVLLSR